MDMYSNGNGGLVGSRSTAIVDGIAYSIPTTTVRQVIQLLEKLQSIQLTEHNPSPPLQYRGQALING